MRKYFEAEYLIIIAALVMVLVIAMGVPVFANGLVTATVANAETTSPQPQPAAQPSTVRTLGTLRENELPNTSSSAAGEDNGDVLQPVQAGNVTYITGGVGDEERSFFDSVKHDYNLHVTSTAANGEYIGNTRLVIHDRQGNELVNVSAGPLFYARLAPGSYSIEAKSEGREQKRNVTIGKSKTGSIQFAWK